MKRAGSQGFTLIELMIAIVIVAIIAAIAYPNYMNSVRKANRAEAKAALTEMAGRQEQHFLNNKRYGTLADLDYPATTENDLYNLTVTATGLTYTLTATPNGSPQSDDAPCLSFTLNHLGVRGVSGSASSTPEDCW